MLKSEKVYGQAALLHRQVLRLRSHVPTPSLARALAAFDTRLLSLLGQTSKNSAAPSVEAIPAAGLALHHLLGVYTRADAAPPAALEVALQEARERLSRIMAGWQSQKTTVLPVLNRQLEAAGLPPLK